MVELSHITEAVWRVFCGAIICALVLQLGGSGPGQGMRKLLSGVFLAALVLSGFGKIDLSGAYEALEGYSAEAERAVDSGQELAREMKFSCITDQCEAYILDKAAELGAQVAVSVTLEPETGLPCAAEITGNVTPWEKQTLSDEITRALGIEKGAQIWNR